MIKLFSLINCLLVCNIHEFHETCHSVTFYFMKKDSKRCCDTIKPESIHTKDESKRGSAFAFIFGVNWPLQWANGMTSFTEFKRGVCEQGGSELFSIDGQVLSKRQEWLRRIQETFMCMSLWLLLVPGAPLDDHWMTHVQLPLVIACLVLVIGWSEWEATL